MFHLLENSHHYNYIIIINQLTFYILRPSSSKLSNLKNNFWQRSAKDQFLIVVDINAQNFIIFLISNEY